MQRHPSFLLKIKITVFYISLSLSLTGEDGVRTLASIKIQPLSLSLSLTGEEGVHTLASIKQALPLSIPHSVSPGSTISGNSKVFLGDIV